MMKSINPTDNPGKEHEIKRVYHTPKLVIYGTLPDITRNVGPKGNVDGGGGAAAGPKTQ